MKPGRPLRRTARLSPVSARRRAERDAEDSWRDAVWRRSYGRCAGERLIPGHTCRGPLAAHHVAQKSTHPHLRLDPTNGTLLCRDLHRWVHDNPSAAERLGLLIRGDT